MPLLAQLEASISHCNFDLLLPTGARKVGDSGHPSAVKSPRSPPWCSLATLRILTLIRAPRPHLLSAYRLEIGPGGLPLRALPCSIQQNIEAIIRIIAVCYTSPTRALFPPTKPLVPSPFSSSLESLLFPSALHRSSRLLAESLTAWGAHNASATLWAHTHRGEFFFSSFSIISSVEI